MKPQHPRKGESNGVGDAVRDTHHALQREGRRAAARARDQLDDLRQDAEGRREELRRGALQVGAALRGGAGELVDDVGERAGQLRRRTRAGARVARRKALRAAAHAREGLAEAGDWSRERLAEGGEQVRGGVRRHPLGSLVLVAGVGLVLGALLARSSRRG